MRHVAQIEDTRQILSRQLDRQNLLRPPPEVRRLRGEVLPYPELGRAEIPRTAPDRVVPIFITGRFRSGSTLMWNLFRHLPATTAYYEPLNERRWFDRSLRGAKVDATHRGVSDYWSEYEGLEELGEYFMEEWKFEHLYMPGHAWNPRMQRYIEILIDHARGRAVLQFNEIDFRLPWIRAKFPQVKLLHIYRHPRDQWCSTLRSAAQTAARCSVREFEPFDGFYLLRWGRDLAHYFPLLRLDAGAPAYELFYQLWRLSYLFGRCHADLSVRFEDLVASPREVIPETLATLDIHDYDLDRLTGIVSPTPAGKWKECADEAWFAGIEARVDADITAYSHCSGFPAVSTSARIGLKAGRRG